MGLITLLLYIFYTPALYIIVSQNINYLEIIKDNIFYNIIVYLGE
jgi:hypothetical protein